MVLKLFRPCAYADATARGGIMLYGGLDKVDYFFRSKLFGNLVFLWSV